MSIHNSLMNNARKVLMQQQGETSDSGILHRTADGRLSTRIAAILGEERSDTIDKDGSRQNVRIRVVQVPVSAQEGGISAIRREDIIVIGADEWRVLRAHEPINGMHAVEVIRPEVMNRGGRSHFSG